VAADWPGLKVLLTSGFANEALEVADGERERFPMLPKPYNRGELARALRRMLEA
jgi:hypothetical protein